MELDGSRALAEDELARLLRLHERREPLVTRIATYLGVGIIEGRIAPHEHLISIELAERFHTSRTPVREALMILEQEGLVEFRARRRARVAAFTVEDVRDIYLVRADLMMLLGRLVAARATDLELHELTQQVAGMRALVEADDIDGYFWGHVALQQRMTEVARNQALRTIVDSLGLRTLVLRRASLREHDRPQQSVRDQERVVEALQSRDGEYAAMLLGRSTRAALAAIEREAYPAPNTDSDPLTT
jgi:DNA-binding GntR family transcriptional regulator